MPAGTLGAAFPRNGIEDVVIHLNDELVKERRRIACVKTQYLLIRTELNICYRVPEKAYDAE